MFPPYCSSDTGHHTGITFTPEGGGGARFALVSHIIVKVCHNPINHSVQRVDIGVPPDVL